jgi:hypothetical protein
MIRLLRCAALLLVLSPLAGAEPTAVLTVRNGSAAPLAFTAAELAALPRREVTALNPHDQVEHRYAGVAVRELLARAGAPLGDQLRGAALQLVVIAHSRDGYGVAYALADFDESFSSRIILLADQEDGKPLAETVGPFRLVAPGDKKAARWARMVTSLEIVSVTPKS